MTKSQVIALLLAATVKVQRFNALLPLLGSKKPGSFAHYNRVGYSKDGLASLEYDIKKTYGITDKELRVAKSAFAKADSQKEEGSEKDKIPAITPEVQLGVFVTAPDEVKKEVKLRDRYPFLNDPETPHLDKFFVLVGLNGTAYHQVLEARKELFKKLLPSVEEDAEPSYSPMSNEEIFEVAVKAVENFELNLEGVAELDYYQEHKEILGKHKIFEDVMLEKQVAGYSDAKIQKQYTNLKGYANRELSQYKKHRDEGKKAVFVEKIRRFEKEIRLIEERLGVKPEDAFVSKVPEAVKQEPSGTGKEE